MQPPRLQESSRKGGHRAERDSRMKNLADRLRDVTEEASERLAAWTDQQAEWCPAPGKWCSKEILGHLVDSATNNHRRFVEAQLRDELVFPGYDQEAWVAVQGYRSPSWQDLLALWRALNLHLAQVMAAAPETKR